MKVHEDESDEAVVACWTIWHADGYLLLRFVQASVRRLEQRSRDALTPLGKRHTSEDEEELSPRLACLAVPVPHEQP